MQVSSQLFNAALQHLRSGDLVQANHLARQATDANPNDAWAWYVRAASSAKLHRPQDAIREYRQATTINPNEAAFHLELGDVYLEESDWSAAAQSFTQALNFDAQNAFAKAGLGAALGALGRTEDAVRLLREAHELAPGDRATAERYTLALLVQITESWSTYPDGTKDILSEAQLTFSQGMLAEIDRVGAVGDDEREALEEVRGVVVAAAKVKIQSWQDAVRYLAVAVVSIVVGVVVLNVAGSVATLGAVIAFVFAAGVIAFFIWRRRVVGWRWARRMSDRAARATGLQ